MPAMNDRAYTIYRRQGAFVVRASLRKPEGFVPVEWGTTADTLEEARSRVSPGFQNIGAVPDNDAIVEVWVDPGRLAS